MRSLTITLTLALTLAASAKEWKIRYSWDASVALDDQSTVLGYQVWDRTAPVDGPLGEWQAVAATSDLEVLVPHPMVRVQSRIIAFGLFDHDNDPATPPLPIESEPSDTMTVEVPPQPPLAPKAFNAVLVFEESTNLQEWTPVVGVVIDIDDQGKKYFRVRIEPTTTTTE